MGTAVSPGNVAMAGLARDRRHRQFHPQARPARTPLRIWPAISRAHPSSPASRSAKPSWSTPKAPASWRRSCRPASAPSRRRSRRRPAPAVYPAERSCRRHSHASRQSGRESQRRRSHIQRNHSQQHPRAGDRPERRGKERTEGRGRQDRDARARAASGRNADAVAATRHAIAGAAQHHRRFGKDAPVATANQYRRQYRSFRRQHNVRHRDDRSKERRPMFKPRSIIDPTTWQSTLIRAAVACGLVASVRPWRRWRRLRAADPAACAGDQGGGERSDLAVYSARHRQIRRDRPAGRHQGCPGRRSQDRQRGDPLVPPRLYDRRHRRSDQHLFLRRRRQADRRLRHRRDARPQRLARRAQADACRTAKSTSKASATASCCPARRRTRRNRNRPTISPPALVGAGTKVVNGITVRGRDQVMLKVTVAEVQRDVIKQLGIDLSGSLNYGAAVVNFNTSNPFSASGQALSDTAATGSFRNVTATLRAMERAGVIRTLAEPNLTAISGETASFVAGGEFPIPNGLSCDTTKSPPVCQPQIIQEIRRQPGVHAGGAVGRPHQPESDDRGVRPVDGKRHDPAGARLDPVAHRSLDPHPPRRYHGRDSRPAARSRSPA